MRKIAREWIHPKTGSYYVEYEPIDGYQPPLELAAPPTTGIGAALALYAELTTAQWDTYRRSWRDCECELCVAAHKPQRKEDRDPETGHGCPIGATGWEDHQQALTEIRERTLPHGHLETYKKGCRCEPCATAIGTRVAELEAEVAQMRETREADPWKEDY